MRVFKTRFVRDHSPILPKNNIFQRTPCFLTADRLPRYKYLVQVVMGEMKGAGVRMGARCLWDPNTDKICEEVFMNDSLFCCVAVFGVYLY